MALSNWFFYIQAGKHQEYEQKLLQDLYKLNPTFLQTSAVSGDKPKGKASSLQRYSNTCVSVSVYLHSYLMFSVSFRRWTL